jgi:ribosomal protein L11 methyltransferase
VRGIAWLALELTLDAAQATALSDALLEAGAISVDVADARAGTDQETPIFQEPGEETELAYGSNRMIALFDSDTDAAAALGRACAVAGIDPLPEYRTAKVPEQDWVKLTQNQFAPMRVSARLWVVPSWHAAPDGSAINIVLDPGLAFGTGSHPTTRLCLDWLDRHLFPGSSVIDYGCGSGILAIAAAKLGAGRVVGVDIDPLALVASRYNADQNRVAATFVGADGPRLPPADVVMANILSNPLKILAPLLAELTVPGGHAVLSGILAPQARAVADAYSEWFDMEPPVEEQGWIRLCGKRLK